MDVPRRGTIGRRVPDGRRSGAGASRAPSGMAASRHQECHHLTALGLAVADAGLQPPAEGVRDQTVLAQPAEVGTRAVDLGAHAAGAAPQAYVLPGAPGAGRVTGVVAMRPWASDQRPARR